ncbi:glycosyltransferase family 4 protein [Hymenobacter sp. BT507]|uniref:Glycosyltransferase family 4 protein n=1 Tax=Hymenobacter citatus TaxID=2763506 RepID=A0ABR7MKN7_9BACT|nr:glycosyltransferase family 1 protein [Hymenobacter citatus]MBC6611648.1 glycosyltransferase family 4 protein [Hymenobacter citatus]
MAVRRRIALIYTYNESWIGGTYYIENLVAALAQLPDAQQPELLIFSWDEADEVRLKKAVQYPYWSFRRFERTLSLPERILNKITAIVLRKRFISLLYSDADIVFPLPTGSRQYFSRIPYHLYWIPDFQEHYLPAFFSSEEIAVRKVDQQLILKLAQNIVFSSHAAQNDFNAIYPNSGLAQHILQFAVTSKPVSTKENDCLSRYGIAQPYFICSNQFWKHKNHPTVLRALANLKQTHPDALIVFTGKEQDYRNPAYFEELMNLREELTLHNEVKFLGFIPREDQLALMQQAVAVIQPSLFEGWSTVVEDAKSLNAPLIASNIAVHQEQLAEYKQKLFFEPKDAEDLTRCLEEVLQNGLHRETYNYNRDVKRFAHEFVQIVDSIVGV